MRIQNQNKRGVVSEFLVRIMSILLLIAIFIIFSFIVQLSQCGCSDSETLETLSSDSDKTLFLDTAIDNMLNSNITISFKAYISDDGLSKTPKLSKSRIVISPKVDSGTEGPQQSITLPLWKAIAIYADYDKSVFKEESDDFKKELEETITDYISTALSKINETVTWKEYVVIDKKAIIIPTFSEKSINTNFIPPNSETMVSFPSDYTTIYKKRTIPKLSASDPLSSLELIIQFEK